MRARFAVVIGCVVAGCRATPTPDPAAVDARWAALADTTWPAGPLGASARRGHALMANTHESLPSYAPGGLRCLSCHLDDGTRRNGLPLIGVFARYPQYRARSGHMDLITDRVNDCFLRSLNGKALPPEGADMRDIVTYLAWMSRGMELFDSARGGAPKLAPLAGDTARGAVFFATTCARCHGVDGAGIPPVPPLWGPRSFNIGAGMARLNTAAAFIRYNMPFDKPNTITDQEAFDVASFVVSRPRPDLPGKEKDWPNGDAPADAAYHTAAGRHSGPAARSTPTSAP